MQDHIIQYKLLTNQLIALLLTMVPQSPKKGFRERIKSYFTLICGGTKTSEPPIQKDQLQSPTSKKKRLTFTIDRVLIKLSRRNMAAQQFGSRLEMQSQLEKHLALRLKQATMVVFRGDFSQDFMRSVFFPIQLLTDPPEPSIYVSPINEILSNSTFPLRNIGEGIDAMVSETSKLQQIQQTLTKHCQKIENFIFICPSQLDTQPLQQLFIALKQRFMYEIERIMVLDRCVRKVIYISPSHTFLDIDIGSLIQFLAIEVVKKDKFVDRYQLSLLLDRLFKANCYLQSISIIGDLLVTKQDCLGLEKQFISRLQLRYPQTKSIVSKFTQQRRRSRANADLMLLPMFIDNTPIFAEDNLSIQRRNSKTNSMISYRKPGPFQSFGRPQLQDKW